MNKGIWLSVHPSAKTAGCIHFWCVQMDLSTLSTGFSTGIVKKAPVFPRCFPLFPLSFPHFPVKRFIHGVLYRADLCENQGNYGPLHLFSERKSNPKIYFLQQAENPLVEFLPVGMKKPIVFHTRFLQKSTCGKQRENLSFQQKETALSGKAVRVLPRPLRRSRARFPLLSPTVTSSPGAGEVFPLRGSFIGAFRQLQRARPSRDLRNHYAEISEKIIFPLQK